MPAVPGSQVPPEIQDSNLPGPQSPRPKDRGRVLAAAAATYKVHTDSKQPVDKVHSHCSLEAAAHTWVERSHSPDMTGTGTAGSPDKKAGRLPSAMDSPALAPVVAEMPPEKADSLLLGLDTSVLVLVPDILEEGHKAHSRAGTVELPMDERAMPPSRVLGA